MCIAEWTKAVLGAVAKVRKTLAGRKPKLSRGRPSQKAKKAARQSKRIQQKVADLFEHRHLFVKHHLSVAEEKILKRITRVEDFEADHAWPSPTPRIAPDHGSLPAV